MLNFLAIHSHYGRGYWIIFLVIVYLFLYYKKKKSRDDGEDENTRTPQSTDIAIPASEKRYVLHNISKAEEQLLTQPYGENAYIQNNNKLIEYVINVYNPRFKAAAFCEWAKNIVTSAAHKGIEYSRGIVTQNFADNTDDISDIKSGSVFFKNYLSLYKIENDTEYMTVFMSIAADNADSVDTLDKIAALPKYFAVFKRASQYNVGTSGESRLISCPNCGGSLTLNKGDISAVCPYCGHITRTDENDWLLDSFKRITADTPVNNGGAIKIIS